MFKLNRNWIVWVLFTGFNLTVLANTLFHDPGIAYDAMQHLSYINVLSQSRLPQDLETAQFFAPPLPYVLPAALYATQKIPLQWVIKISQIFNFFLSLGITALLMHLCEKMRPGNSSLKITSLLVLAMMAAYQRSMVMVRGEPYLAFFTLLALSQTIYFSQQESPRIKTILLLGLSLAGLALSRQWGFLIWPGIAIFLLIRALTEKPSRPQTFFAIGAIFAIAILSSGWFYARLHSKYGSLAAFNRTQKSSWSLSNQPQEFYAGHDWNKLFTDPIRPSLANQFPLIFYSDLWGDYWAYFSVNAWDKKLKQYIPGIMLEDRIQKNAQDSIVTNRHFMSSKLGQANIAGLIPTSLILLGLLVCVFSLGPNKRPILSYFFDSPLPRSQNSKDLLLLFLLTIGFSMAGYLWFLIGHPSPDKGDTIKASYMFQILPLLALLAGEALETIKNRSKNLGFAIFAILCLSVLHNAPFQITRYNNFILNF